MLFQLSACELENFCLFVKISGCIIIHVLCMVDGLVVGQADRQRARINLILDFFLLNFREIFFFFLRYQMNIYYETEQERCTY